MGWLLTAEALEATREKIDKINAKASKKGLSGRLEVIALDEVCDREGLK